MSQNVLIKFELVLFYIGPKLSHILILANEISENFDRLLNQI